MHKDQAQISLKNLNSQRFSLNPDAIITLFEIDASDVLFDVGLLSNTNKLTDNSIFRFHNSLKLFDSSIYFQKKEYVIAPIFAIGFEVSNTGTLPVPRLSITVNDEGIPSLALLKERIKDLGDLTGCKVTRRRTLAKYLDIENFVNQIAPDDFEPDSNLEFTPDVFYIDRKSFENKYSLEYELVSILDLEGIKLPGRLVIADRCMAHYRGNGCLYEYGARRVVAIHGESGKSVLPDAAPPIANDKDEKVFDVLDVSVINNRGEYDSSRTYSKGDFIYITKGNYKYYFVAKINDPQQSPPDLRFWFQDQCSKLVVGCRLRWGSNGSVIPGATNIIKGQLMYNGYSATNKLIG